MTRDERQAEYDYRRRERLGIMEDGRPTSPEQETLAADEARAGIAAILEYEANHQNQTPIDNSQLPLI